MIDPFLGAVASPRHYFTTRGTLAHVWRHFLVVTLGRVGLLLASDGQRPGLPPHTLPHTGQAQSVCSLTQNPELKVCSAVTALQSHTGT